MPSSVGSHISPQTITTTAPLSSNDGSMLHSTHSTAFQRGVSPRRKSDGSKKAGESAEKVAHMSGAAGSAPLQRSVFKSKKLGTQKKMVPKLRSKFASPTDTLLSPCSKKLTSHKTKFLLAKSNPTKLSFKEMKKTDSDDLMGDYASEY